MLKELESLFSISVWEFDSQAGIACFFPGGCVRVIFMLGSYNLTELTHIILL